MAIFSTQMTWSNEQKPNNIKNKNKKKIKLKVTMSLYMEATFSTGFKSVREITFSG